METRRLGKIGFMVSPVFYRHRQQGQSRRVHPVRPMRGGLPQHLPVIELMASAPRIWNKERSST